MKDSRGPARGTTGLPVLAMTVPVLGAVALWVVTGSVLSLWFAALAPLMAVAGFGDRVWAARRARRRDDAVAQADSAALSAALEEELTHRRDRAWRASPDIRRLLEEPAELWREVPGRQEHLVLGSGDVATELPAAQLTGLGAEGSAPKSMTRVLGAGGPTMRDAPIVVPLRGSLGVDGPEPLVAGVVRAMIVQLCLVHPPGRLEIVGDLPESFAWVEELPHRVTPGQHRVALGFSSGWEGAAGAADATILVGSGRGAAVRMLVGQTSTGAAHAALETAETTLEVVPQVLSEFQASLLARSLRGRIAPTAPDDSPLALGDLLAPRRTPAPGAGSRTLAGAIGTSGARPFCLDLVSDGPHALVVGTTGSGKSELLRTWVVSLAAHYTPEDVVFVLADFKGGTAFSSLRSLPHVTGVLTDLDAAAATRGLEGLRAEVRRREGVLAAVGIRDIAEGATGLPRLVVVVDEFATLLSSHGELAHLFIDLTARGRALGIHVILGTQRATGVFREALLANCLLRVVLRAADAADCRLMLGDDTPQRRPAGAHSAGTAHVRRAGDERAVRIRVAVADDEFVSELAARAQGARVPAPWLEPLPADARLPRREGNDDMLLIGIADEPHLQRQEPIGLARSDRGLCVIGAAGSGVTTALHTIAAQIDRVDAWIDAGDLEAAWDDLNRVAVSRDGAVVVDEADALLAALPPDYAHAAAGLLETIARSSGEERQFLLGLERLTAPLARIADLMSRRLLLRHTQRTDYLAAGGMASHHDPTAPPGRGRLSGTLVQVYRAEASPRSGAASHPSLWLPPAGLTSWVTRATPGAERTHEQWLAHGVEIMSPDDVLGAGVPPMIEPGRSRVVRAEPEQWQRFWAALTTLRAQGPLLIDPSCSGEYRILTGRRDLPPLCLPGAPRGWLLEPGCDVGRVRLG
ncbi:MAG: hypothetical protein BGO47_03805 [Microbacterium sp. 67-17]|nr:MAG: hypothetical protein BGO47_03805 [Microbacterium sp. 67-17]